MASPALRRSTPPTGISSRARWTAPGRRSTRSSATQTALRRPLGT